MIAKDKTLKKICRNYHLVENYMQARFDKDQFWDMHHRRETDEMKSKQQLIDEGIYFDVEPEELIFLTHSEHTRLHITNALPEVRKKLSDAAKGENNPMYGKPGTMLGKKFTEEHRNKMAEAKKGENNPMYGKPGTMIGKHHSAESRKKISESLKGKEPWNKGKKISEANRGNKWWNNGEIAKLSRECPGEGFIKGRLKK